MAHFTNVLKFWRSVETFALPDISAKRSRNKVYQELEAGKTLPWEPGALPAAKEGKQWRHTIYFHVIDKEAVVDLLARLSGSEDYREPVGGRTCLSAMVVDQLGRPNERSYSSAAYIFGVRILREKRDPELLPELLKKAHEDYVKRWELDGEEVGRVDWGKLQKELSYLKGLAGQGLPVKVPVLCVSEAVNVKTAVEAPFLNSYYLQDLNMLIGLPSLGRPLETFLSVGVGTRTDLSDAGALMKSLNPRDLCAGRWPASPEQGLYSAQQVALNLGLGLLGCGGGGAGSGADTDFGVGGGAGIGAGNGAGFDSGAGFGLIGINGPPGTGKTTLLRDVVAEVVVSRARRLLGVKVGDLFAGRSQKIAEMVSYYTPDGAVFGNDGIVVASNNNTAVENISRELPLVRSVDVEAFDGPEYFSSIATNIQGEACWGMISAVLGRSENRSAFIDKFWFNSGRGFGRYLKGEYGKETENERHYEETAKELRGLLEEFDRFKNVAGEYHGLVVGAMEAGVDSGDVAREGMQAARGPVAGAAGRLGELAAVLKGEYGIPDIDLPGIGFWDLSLAEIHRMRPYLSRKINLLRSKIFLCSLELHEWAIRANALQFNNNLNAFVDMVSNKHAGLMDEGITAVLWNTFFFCVPVVSLTLASFQRQFTKMGQGSLGWLLLDEAGQATPASACGAIWRSKRCMVIGDTLQIPPVVTIPKGLGKLLQDYFTVEDDCWSPLYSSVQTLADRVTSAGTYVGQDIWTGLPLRAHRRCSEPMFSIANVIAYDNQMVRVGTDRTMDFPTGESGWIDVQGVTADGHLIREELMVLEEMLGRLGDFFVSGRAYVISPFRSVADVCYEEFNVKGRVECGTIHTFQGKEAEVVFVVLGTLPENARARDWVAGTPNMLNVAVTRAKDRLYVIGNRRIWGRHRYFSELARVLPVKEHISGRLF